MRKLLLFALSTSVLFSVYAQPGSLNPSFAHKGILVDDLAKTYNIFYEDTKQLLTQHDNKTIALIQASVPPGPSAKTAIFRHLANGLLDSSFGTNGFMEIDILVTKTLLQPDDKILLTGIPTPAPESIASDFYLIRLTKDGQLDESFGTGGHVVTDFGAQDEAATSLAVLDDGRILLAGYTFNGTYHDFALARYNTNGSLDNTFSTDGKLTINFAEADYRVNDMLVQDDGKVVIAGYATVDGTNRSMALARLHPDGRIDKSFGEEGIRVSNLAQNINRITFQPDGKIMSLANSPSKSFVRFLSNGSVDQSYGIGGKVTPAQVPEAFVIQPDGKLVTVGGYPWIVTSRYTLLGQPDATFGNNGSVLYEPTNFDYGTAVTIQNNGNIIAGGRTKIGRDLAFPKYDYRLVSFNTTGAVNEGFGSNGASDGFYPAPHNSFSKIAVQQDGKIIVAGEKSFRSSGFSSLVFKSVFLARYNVDGSVDKTFSEDGETIVSSSGSSDSLLLAIQTDGKIILVHNDKLYRYNGDGALDQSFGSNGVQQIPAAQDVAIQSNNKIIIRARTSLNVPALFRYNANGGLDASFGNAGVQVLESEGKIIIQADDKILVAGINQQDLLNNAPIEITRYLSNGGLDNSFDGDGRLSTPLANFNFGTTVIQDLIAIQTDGKFIIATQASMQENSDFVISRYNSNGTPDQSFGLGGTATTDFGFNNAVSTTLGIHNNRLYVGGFTRFLFFPTGEDTAKGVIAAYQLGEMKPTVGIGDVTVYEREGWANLPITLSQTLSTGLQLHYQTIDGSASHLTSDYRREVGAVYIPAGQSSTTLRLKINRDKLTEPAESFTVQLSLMFAPQDLVSLSDGTAIVTILDGGNPDSRSAAPLSTNDDEQTSIASLSVYPNPSSNYFNIVLQGGSKQVSIKVSDAQGRIVETSNNVTSKGTLQLGHNYQPGVYYIEIIQGNTRQTLKLVKQAY